MKRKIEKSIPIEEKGWEGEVTIYFRRGIIERYKLKGFTLNLENEYGTIKFERRDFERLEKKIDIKTPKYNLDDIVKDSDLPGGDKRIVNIVEMSDGGISKIEIKNYEGGVDVKVDREGDNWHIYGEITYYAIPFSWIWNCLGFVEKETGIDMRKYISKALEEIKSTN